VQVRECAFVLQKLPRKILLALESFGGRTQFGVYNSTMATDDQGDHCVALATRDDDGLVVAA
jgi:hypothetical protein